MIWTKWTDRIISILINKWYVRCWVDWFVEEDFDYIRSNILEINKGLNKFDVDSNELFKPIKIELNWIRCVVNLNNEPPQMEMIFNHETESYEPDYFPNANRQEYYILVNTNIIQLESVEEKYWIKLN